MSNITGGIEVDIITVYSIHTVRLEHRSVVLKACLNPLSINVAVYEENLCKTFEMITVCRELCTVLFHLCFIF